MLACSLAQEWKFFPSFFFWFFAIFLSLSLWTGELQSVNYVSDALGFRVAATNIPQQVQPVEIPDAPDVAEAKAKLFALQREHIAKVAASASSSSAAEEEEVPADAEAVESN